MSPSLRAFVFGTALGLLAAVAPSCGAVKVPCGATTCPTGCCKSDGTCATSGDSTCGGGGEACADCTARGARCVGFVCSGGTGGGGGSSGGCKDTCNGCCVGSSSTAICFDPPTRNNCGKDGEDCRTCNTGEVCEKGACVSFGDAGVLGRGCGDDSDCSTLGPGHVCKKKTAGGNAEYYGGYCTKECATGTDCGGNGVCVVHDDPNVGEMGTFCWSRCDTPADCRTPGYDCYPLAPGVKGCWISPFPVLDAGPPADRVGAGCSSDTECTNPPDDGVCLRGQLPDGGLSPWVGGYCTAPCSDSSHCSADGGAGCATLVGSGGTPVAACLRTCDAPNGGPSSCRTGYLCRGARQGDGGLAPRGFCMPSCLNVGVTCPTNTTCQSDGYCR